MYLIKADIDGNEAWSCTFGGTENDWGNLVQQTTDGGFIITGYTHSKGAGTKVYLLKTNANGNEIWNVAFGDVKKESGFGVVETRDGGYVVGGFLDVPGFGKRTGEFLILKLNNNGVTKSIINIRINIFEVFLTLLLWLLFFDVFNIFCKSVDILISFFNILISLILTVKPTINVLAGFWIWFTARP